MNRRTFLERSAKAGLLFGLGGFTAVTTSCRKSYNFDLVIRNGVIFDGTGRPGSRADVGGFQHTMYFSRNGVSRIG